MAEIDFFGTLHRRTQRNYRERVLRGDKPECAAVAKQFGAEYWDGDRRYGYGGYRYDGRWAPVAKQIVEHYGLGAGSTVLDVGCGKGYLLYEMKLTCPDLDICGIDISEYAVEHCKPEISEYLQTGNATELPYEDNVFDLVLSINALHNLYLYDVAKALSEVERVKRSNGYIVVESYRNEVEKDNLFAWQLTCECFFTHDEWVWLFDHCGYSGDYSFIYFE